MKAKTMNRTWMLALSLLVFQSGAQATATAEEAAALGKTLTPLGAEKAGNADGTIPAWDGGITEPPAGLNYQVGQFHPDPYAGDAIRFVIDASNMEQYADQLSAGQKAMFKRYPDFKMNVYPTHRSAAFPERTMEMTMKNATTAKLTPDGEGVLDAAEGFPFPIPKNGYEVIWNHKLKFKGVSARRYNNQVAPTASGAYTLIKLREDTYAPYFEKGKTIADINNILLYFFQEVEAPARLAGNVLLVHETLNQDVQKRQAWVYNPGQRRVRRAPNVAYDNPGTASDGLRTNDMSDMFNGAMDRFNWKLVGKKEMYVPYNSYKVHGADVDFDDLIQPGHLNQDYIRYELHRVWVVEATLKEGMRHINKRRTFYVDEDSWQILMVDHYDARGQLWRYSEAHPIVYYEVPMLWTTLEVHYDTQNGRYLVNGLDNHDKPIDFNQHFTTKNYRPSALRKRGKR